MNDSSFEVNESKESQRSKRRDTESAGAKPPIISSSRIIPSGGSRKRPSSKPSDLH